MTTRARPTLQPQTDYQQRIVIDQDDLDNELVKQPVIYLEVAEDHVRAISVRDQLKEELDAAKAGAELRIRDGAVEDGTKLTEAAVRALVEVDRGYLLVKRRWLSAKQQAERLAAVKEAFAQRAFVLKDLCSLYVAGYFAVSSVAGGDSQQVRKGEYERNREFIARRRSERR